jgi:hypothetical protein
MQIKVLLQVIPNDKLTEILDYYNTNKPCNEEQLELLDRYEGGFKINLPDMKDLLCDDNQKIKQLRWHNSCLVSQSYIRFNKEEETLLYNALAHILGNENVSYI